MSAIVQPCRLEAILGRAEQPLPLEVPLARLARRQVLVTGAAGSLGSALVDLLQLAGVAVIATDTDSYDVAKDEAPRAARLASHVIHLAAWKDAPAGESNPGAVVETNILGTERVLRAFPCARIVFASTCKAADPETVYGATKLIGERMILAGGGTVARFYNVVETSGNVFRTWEQLGEGTPIPVTPCSRQFISLKEAVSLLLWAAVLAPGRYALWPGPSRTMTDVAAALYPGRSLIEIPARRGDRIVEPGIAHCETAEPVHPAPLLRITSRHDQAAG